MKKLLSVFIAVLILCSAVVVLPAFAAEESYKSGDVVTLSFTADDVNAAFTGLEGAVSFGKTLEVAEKDVTFPHISDAMFNIVDNNILFNATNTDNYDISSDKVVLKVNFTVKEDIASLPVEAVLDDIYYRDGTALKNFEKITLPYKLNIYKGTPPETTAPSAETTATGNTTATENNTTATGTPSTDPISSEGSETKSTSATENASNPSEGATSASENVTNPSEGATQATEASEPSETTTGEDTAVTLKKSSAKIYVKKSATIGVTVDNPVGKTTFKSSDSKIAKVNSKGKVTGVKKGKAIITVANNGVTKTFNVTVINPKLNKTKLKLKVNQKFKLKITGKAGKAVFKSSNKKIVAVASSGKLKAKAKGKAVITVKTNGNVKLKCKITVK